jgi:abortive infection bacteriophage resistance protein
MDNESFEELVERFYLDNKNRNTIVELFERVLDALFSDNIFNIGRLITI